MLGFCNNPRPVHGALCAGLWIRTPRAWLAVPGKPFCLHLPWVHTLYAAILQPMSCQVCEGSWCFEQRAAWSVRVCWAEETRCGCNGLCPSFSFFHSFYYLARHENREHAFTLCAAAPSGVLDTLCGAACPPMISQRTAEGLAVSLVGTNSTAIVTARNVAVSCADALAAARLRSVVFIKYLCWGQHLT
jgi:hypothetical protein